MKNIILYLTLIYLATTVSLTSSALWCFQCSWESGDQQGNNLTTCSNQEIDEVKLDSATHNPQMNPKCVGKHRPGLYNKQIGYRILQESCYPSACATKGGESGRCAQWIFYLDGNVMNVTLFCAVSKEVGCFTQTMEDGYTLEACLCNDRHWCNVSDRIKGKAFLIVIVSLICIVNYLFY